MTSLFAQPILSINLLLINDLYSRVLSSGDIYRANYEDLLCEL
jgi:hypothetical protein